MVLESWLPIGYQLSGKAVCGQATYEGTDWQIISLKGGGNALLALPALADKWLQSGLVEQGEIERLGFGEQQYSFIVSSSSHVLCPLSECASPNSKSEAQAFALALKTTREVDAESPLQDAIYVEKLTRLLPTYGITSKTDDDVVLGYWLTGGAHVSAKSFRRLHQMLSWMGSNQLKDVVQVAGFKVESSTEPRVADGNDEAGNRQKAKEDIADGSSSKSRSFEDGPFTLPGRPELESFFNEHVVDIIQHKERYKALGIGFPAAVILHGPPGCGKTFAVEKLVEYLGWPSFEINASSVASPYIHETSRKVAEVFDKAMENAPSVLIIDEMEAFLADRESGGGGSHHRVEEVAEFLRRIPEATQNEVFIVAMTNKIDMIDDAIKRRGRFDHVINVDYASETEVKALLDKLLSTLPKEDDVDSTPLAKHLAGRPLSDVTFVIREGARLAARAGQDKLSQDFLLDAMEGAGARGEQESGRRIGFI